MIKKGLVVMGGLGALTAVAAVVLFGFWPAISMAGAARDTARQEVEASLPWEVRVQMIRNQLKTDRDALNDTEAKLRIAQADAERLEAHVEKKHRELQTSEKTLAKLTEIYQDARERDVRTVSISGRPYEMAWVESQMKVYIGKVSSQREGLERLEQHQQNTALNIKRSRELIRQQRQQLVQDQNQLSALEARYTANEVATRLANSADDLWNALNDQQTSTARGHLAKLNKDLTEAEIRNQVVLDHASGRESHDAAEVLGETGDAALQDALRLLGNEEADDGVKVKYEDAAEVLELTENGQRE